MNKKLELIGVILSVLCAIHCVLLPVLLLTASFWANSFVAHPLFEIALLPLAFVIAIRSVYKDYHLHQKNYPAILLAIGIAIALIGMIGHTHVFIATGASIMVLAQALNWRLHRKYAH